MIFVIKYLRFLKKEVVGDDEILNIFNEIEIWIDKDKYNNTSIEDLKKDFPVEIEKLEEVLLNYKGENDLKFVKEEFPDKWQYLIRKISLSW